MPTLTLLAQVKSLAQWLQFIAGCAQAQGLPPKRIRDLELAAEEALVNVCHYAYPASSGEVEVTCRLEAEHRFVIEIVDRGVPFDPLSLAAPDLTSDLAERQVGGLGVFLMRQLMDEVTSRREGDQNILRLIVQQHQGPEEGA
jgi:anti-sigma regulatory factor (Ser/Thr protein kinase)